MSLRLGDGQPLAEFANGAALSSGAVSRTLTRAELYGNLRDEAVRRGVEFSYGKRLKRAARSPRGEVIATFEDGTEARGDLLVGADGLHSRVRTLIDPNAPKARYLGLLNTGGYAKGVKVPSPIGTLELIFGKRCFFGYVAKSSDEVWWFANPARPKEPSRESLAAITPEAWREELLDLFSVDASPACDLIRATDTLFTGWSTYDFPKVPRWHRDRMILVGDAAHAASPSSGQGASMAIEDSIVLAKCVRDAPDLDIALSEYESLRRSRVERIVAVGKQSGDGKTPGPLGRAVRDFFLRQVFTRMNHESEKTRWIYDHPLPWA